MKNKVTRIDADFVIAGGGIPGVCAAIQAARMGLKTVLINNRPSFGGNGSGEIMINICGATGTQEFNNHARETGIIEELITENIYRNPNGNRWIWDSVILEKLYNEENLLLFPNTCIDEVHMKGKKIKYIAGTQSTNEKRFKFYAPVFMDDTGDGTVAFLSGARYHYGRESKSEFGESIAPDEADNSVLPSTMVFFSEKRDHPVSYKAPSFATDFTKTNVFEYREIPKDAFDQFVWFYEIDGNLNQVDDAEDIIKHHKQFIYGIWDYIKNSGNFDADNHELSYIAPIMGKREGRRFLGDYVLKEEDLIKQKDFDDTVGYGGWSIDLHAIDGFYSKEIINRHIFLDGVYQIPYRSGYSKDTNNLFLAGRCMSTSHVAFGSTRVMSTLATVAQANAVAAFLCKKYNCTPRDVGKKHIDELQRVLLKHDQHIIGKKYSDNENLASEATINVSSVRDIGYTDGEGSLIFNMPYSITFPVIKKFSGIKLFLKSSEDTTIKYSLYKPSKPENYNPDKLIFSGEVAVNKSDTFNEVILEGNKELETGFYFLWIEENDKISAKCGSRHLTETVTSYLLSAENEITWIDVKTLKNKKALWRKSTENLCYETIEKEDVFKGENLINGYSRQYKLPNAWQSKGVENEFVEFNFKKAVDFSKAVLLFDSSLSEYIRCTKTRTERVRPLLVKDYEIQIKDKNGDYKTVAEVKDNYQRYNEIDLGEQNSDSLRIVFKSTNGQPYISLFDVRIY